MRKVAHIGQKLRQHLRGANAGTEWYSDHPALPNPHSCNYCQRIKILYPKTRSLKQPISFFEQIIDFTAADLINGVKDECKFCQWIAELDGIQEAMLVEDSLLRLKLLWDNMKLSSFGFIDFLTKSGDKAGEHRFTTEVSSDPVKQINFFAASDPAGQYVRYRPMNLQPGSERSFGLARRWLKSCIDTHPECRPIKTTPPGRLLHISGTSTHSLHVSLCEGPKSTRYLALSYCWGEGEQLHKTTENNIAAYLKALTWANLPKTIQDAIITTWSLEYEYLWIDSLCIIQDDEDDKAREIGRMPGIYQGATMVIAATRSKNVTKGFLGPRDVSSIDDTVMLPFKTPYGLGNVIFYLGVTNPGGPSHRDRTEDYTADRAWCFQERTLAKRTICFGESQTRWICPGAAASYKDESLTYQHVDGSEPPCDMLPHTLNGRQPLNVSRFPDAKSVFNYWENILIPTYTACNLSNFVDRLNAIGAIAQIVHERTQSIYLAGLWGSRIADSLMWYRCRQDTTEPAIRWAPSWSWATFPGQVAYHRKKGKEDRVNFISADIQPRNFANPFGSVSRASLKISGRVKAVKYIEKELDSLDMISTKLTNLESENGEDMSSGSSSTCYAEMDTLCEPSSQRKKAYLLLTREDSPTKTGFRRGDGLVLSRVGESSTYTRLGTFFLSHPWNYGVSDPTEEWQVQEIILV